MYEFGFVFLTSPAKSAFLGDGEGSFYWRDQQPCEEESFNLSFMNYGKEYTESRSSAEHHGTKKRCSSKSLILSVYG